MQYVEIPAWVHSAAAAVPEDYKDLKAQYGNMLDDHIFWGSHNFTSHFNIHTIFKPNP